MSSTPPVNRGPNESLPRRDHLPRHHGDTPVFARNRPRPIDIPASRAGSIAGVARRCLHDRAAADPTFAFCRVPAPTTADVRRPDPDRAGRSRSSRTRRRDLPPAVPRRRRDDELVRQIRGLRWGAALTLRSRCRRAVRVQRLCELLSASESATLRNRSRCRPPTTPIGGLAACCKAGRTARFER